MKAVGTYEMPKEPNWKPIESQLPKGIVDNFMYMGRTRLADNTVIEQYKDSTTRSYLFIDHAGNFYDGKTTTIIPKKKAIVPILEDMESFKVTLEMPFSEMLKFIDSIK